MSKTKENEKVLVALLRFNYEIQRFRRSAWLRSPLWIYLLIALLLRIWLIVHTQGVIDGDGSLVGIQAEHILRGEHPVYFYGQVYLGSLGAYLVAMLFAIAGPAVWVLRSEPVLLSLVLVYLTWKLAALLAEMASLPPAAQSYFMNIAALLAAIAPLYDTVLAMRLLSGYIEIFVLILILFIAALRLIQRWGSNASTLELAFRWAGIGFILGLGFWINPLIISAVLATACWFTAYCIAEIIRLLRHGKTSSGRSASSFLLSFSAILAVFPVFVVGSAPALYWGATHHWDNVTYLLQRGEGTQIGTMANLAGVYVSCAAPRVISGALLQENAILLSLHTLPLLLGVGSILASLAFVISSCFRQSVIARQAQRLVTFPLLFAGWNAFFFCIGSGPSDCSQDGLGRYATPLMLVLPFFVAASLTSVYSWTHEHDERIQRYGRFSWSFAKIHTLLVAMLLVALGMQVLSYGLTDSEYTFQSPSCMLAPVTDDPIIHYMQQEHIKYAWAISWIGYPIVFKTNETIILADPRTLLARTSSLGRMPEYVEAVLNANRPSMLIFIRHDDHYPELLRVLDSKQVTYRSIRFPALSGRDLLLVTPLNRTFSPLELPSSQSIFVPCGGY